MKIIIEMYPPLRNSWNQPPNAKTSTKICELLQHIFGTGTILKIAIAIHDGKSEQDCHLIVRPLKKLKVGETKFRLSFPKICE